MENNLVIAAVGIAIMFVLMILRLPIGVAMGVVGLAGFTYIVGPEGAFGLLQTVPYSTARDYALSVIPLFILMGNFAFSSGLSRELYTAGYKWLGHLPGGLAIATVAACAGFGAICGSAPATAATMGTVAIPEMRKYKYDDSIATGCVAAGGTLGLLIPPSVGFIIYGILTQQSIGKLFMSGIMVGILLAVLFSIIIIVIAKRNPELAPCGEKASLKQRMRSIKDIWGTVLLFVVVIGGMMIGLFTATEGAAIGAFGALLISILRRQLTWKTFSWSVLETGRTTAMIFAIMIGAYLFGYFLTVTGLPNALATFITSLKVSRYLIMAGIFFIYVFLGCIMDSLAMILLTVPIFYPGIMALGFDPIWFGAFIILVINQGLITPPVGMNVFIIKGVARDVPLHTIFKGVLPFWLAIFACAILITVFPEIALFLPNLGK